jgi:hypothetical protein
MPSIAVHDNRTDRIFAKTLRHNGRPDSKEAVAKKSLLRIGIQYTIPAAKIKGM